MEPLVRIAAPGCNVGFYSRRRPAGSAGEAARDSAAQRAARAPSVKLPPVAAEMPPPIAAPQPEPAIEPVSTLPSVPLMPTLVTRVDATFPQLIRPNAAPVVKKMAVAASAIGQTLFKALAVFLMNLPIPLNMRLKKAHLPGVTPLES